MAVTKYPKALNNAYTGMLTKLRTDLQWFEQWLNKRPKAKPDVALTLSVFMAQQGLTPTVPGNQRIITSGVKVTAPAITGTYVNGYTFTVVNGVITAIVAS